MPQIRFDSCVVYEGLTPEVSIKRVTFEPPLDATQAESNTGYLTINSGFTETVETEAQDTWFNDQEGQTYTRIRTLLSVDATITRMLFGVVRAVSENRGGQEGGNYDLLLRLVNGDHNFDEGEATQASELLGLGEIHQMPGDGLRQGHFHPGRTHTDFKDAVKKLLACVRVLSSQNLQTANAEGNYGKDEEFNYTFNGAPVAISIGTVTQDKLFSIESGMTAILQSSNLSGLEMTIGDNGEEVREASLPRIIFNEVPLSANHITVMMLSYIDTDALREEFDETLDGDDPTPVDFTFSNVASAIVQSNVYIPSVATTGEESLNPDTGNVSPQASIFQDLRGVFAATNRTLDVPAGYTATKNEGSKSSGVSLSGFEDEISAMSVDVINEEVRNTLIRQATVFSNLWASRRRNDAIDLSFVFNERLFLKQSTTFPKLYDNENFSALQAQLGGGVSRIRVYKQLVNPRLVINDNSLSTTSRSSLMLGRDEEKIYISVGPGNEQLITEFTGQIYFGIGQDRSAFAQGLKFITCTDYENEDNARNSIGNTYRYGVEIDYVDPTVDMVLKLTNLLLEKAQEFKDIASDLGTLPSATAEDRRELHAETEERCNRILGRGGIAALLDNLAEVAVVEGAQNNISVYLEQLKGNSNQTVYERAEGILRIADILEFYGSELEIELRKTVPGIEVYPGDDSPSSANYAESAGSGLGSTSRSTTSIDYVFNKTVPSDLGAGYDYLRYDPVATENPGLEVISLSDFINRCDIETEKHFRSTIGIQGITREKVRYFTPAVVVDPLGQALVQDSESRFDYKQYTNFTAGLISYKSQKKDVVAVNKSAIGPVVEESPIFMLLDELSKKGVTVEYFTDKNRDREIEANRSSFSDVALGKSDKLSTNSNQEDLKDREGNLNHLIGEDQEVREVVAVDIDVSKALVNMISPMTLSTNTNGTQNFDKVNSFTKVVLETPERNFSNLSTFPNQLKAMINIVLSKHDQDEEEYEKYNFNFEEIRPIIGPNQEQTGLTDPMRDYSRFASYWLNYKQIKKIEILSGFDLTDSRQINTANPVWREITVEDINSLPARRSMFCRFSSLTGDMVEMLGLNSTSGLDLPVYNEYFLLTRASDEEGFVIEEQIIEEENVEEEAIPPEQFQVSPDIGTIEDIGNIEYQIEGNINGVIEPLDLDKALLPGYMDKIEDVQAGLGGYGVGNQAVAINVNMQAGEMNMDTFKDIIGKTMSQGGYGAGVINTREGIERTSVGYTASRIENQSQVDRDMDAAIDNQANVNNQAVAGVGAGVAAGVGAGVAAGVGAGVAAGIGAGVAAGAGRIVDRNVGGDFGGGGGGYS